ncbi:hypothetical protein [Ureibacillus endophyticus]|uniref:Uncharacterized protein n=1 Tax=Ureibacillus endophyticus TaxID=1978490 RepID=A0A494YTK1_9BACL|nr:hypothetical protein [Lysinibacillus endophyticus]RKQ13459.1 hypothetical protein D8M03_16120 [Lysinibacillus endophyticus]
MKNYYYHPTRKKLRDIPVFVDLHYSEALKYFLRTAEILEPQMIRDIEEMIPLFSQTEDLHEQLKTDKSFIDNWSLIEKCDENNNSHLLKLKKALLNWGKKYNLYTEERPNSTTFLEVALWAIPDRKDHEKDMEERKEYLEQLGFTDVNYREEWSITNVIYEEYEAENSEEKISFDKLFPFVFSPDSFNIYGLFKDSNLEPLASDYESLLSDFRVNLMLAQSKEMDLKDFSFGVGWDPRISTWSEFEERIDEAYKTYKKLYKERTKAYLEEKGYVEGIKKRNKEHFEWLVRYQIQKWPIHDIADFYSTPDKILAEDTIRKGLSATASILDLCLR